MLSITCWARILMDVEGIRRDGCVTVSLVTSRDLVHYKRQPPRIGLCPWTGEVHPAHFPVRRPDRSEVRAAGANARVVGVSQEAPQGARPRGSAAVGVSEQ